MAKKTISLGRTPSRPAAPPKPSSKQDERLNRQEGIMEKISSDDPLDAPPMEEDFSQENAFSADMNNTPEDVPEAFFDEPFSPEDTLTVFSDNEGKESLPAHAEKKAVSVPVSAADMKAMADKAAKALSPALKTFGAEMKRGILTENPVLRLVLGTCPTLAVTTAASNAIGMGLAATLVLICSNTVISLLRHIIPDKVRIPAYITVIASFVSVVQMLVKAYAPSLDESLGIYLPLIVVNCIILGRAEMYAGKHAPLSSALDGLAMGVGFTTALLCMGVVREVLGAGAIFGHSVPLIQPMLFFSLAPGGFFVFGLLIAAANRLSRENNLPVRTGCGDCPAAATCRMSDKGGCR